MAWSITTWFKSHTSKHKYYIPSTYIKSPILHKSLHKSFSQLSCNRSHNTTSPILATSTKERREENDHHPPYRLGPLGGAKNGASKSRSLAGWVWSWAYGCGSWAGGGACCWWGGACCGGTDYQCVTLGFRMQTECESYKCQDQNSRT